jgi:hypothetical protein
LVKTSIYLSGNTTGCPIRTLYVSFSGGTSMAKKPKLGTGKRFKNLKNALAKKPGVTDPAALAAAIGRKKFGKKKFNALSHGSGRGHKM